MAGGGEAGLTASVLETPTFVLAVVFFVFLALSFAFELFIHHITAFFTKRGRHGLAEAVQKIVMELTLLGFVSLLLTALSGPLGRMCVDYSSTLADWTMQSNVEGCPCCMANTAGLSMCTQMEHECLFNVTTRKPFCDCGVTGTSAYAASGYGAAAAAGAVPEECRPFDLTESQFFLDMTSASMYSLADSMNVTLGELCAEVASGSKFITEYKEDPSLIWDSATWEDLSSEGERRRLLGFPQAQQQYWLPGQGTHIGLEGAGGKRQGQRRLLGGQGAEEAVNPLDLLLRQDPNADTIIHLLPRFKLFKCTGPFLSSACPNGQVPLISEHALHQMHIYLFCVAIFHVAVSVVQFLLGRLRLQMWRRWERQAQEGGAHLGMLQPSPLGRVYSTRRSKNLEPGTAATAPDPPEDAAKAAETPGMTGVDGGSSGNASQDAFKDQVAADVEAAEQPAAGRPDASCGSVWAETRRWGRRAQQRWLTRRADMPGARHYLLEAGICFVQALSPYSVTRHNFLLMRASWLASRSSVQLSASFLPGPQLSAPVPAAPARTESKPALQSAAELPIKGQPGSVGGSRPWHQPDFVDHMLACLENDLPSFVGLSVEMGVVACVILLLLGVTEVIGRVFLMLAAGLLLLTNVALVAMLRHSCRGGRPNSMHERAQWWRNPHVLLAVPIRLILFLCSFVYSSLVFFAWQFGSRSCFFTGEENLWGVWGLPWWSGLLAAALMLLWVGLVTIPSFSLVVHPRKRAMTHSPGHGGGSAGSSSNCGQAHSHEEQATPALAGKPSYGTAAPGNAGWSSGLADSAVNGSNLMCAGPTAAPEQRHVAPVAAGQADGQAASATGDATSVVEVSLSMASSSIGRGVAVRDLEASLRAEVSRLRARVAQLERQVGAWDTGGSKAVGLERTRGVDKG